MGTDLKHFAPTLQSAKNKNESIKRVFQAPERISHLRVVFDKHLETKQGQKNPGYDDEKIFSMPSIKAISPFD